LIENKNQTRKKYISQSQSYFLHNMKVQNYLNDTTFVKRLQFGEEKSPTIGIGLG
jgi:hypothetical protein